MSKSLKRVKQAAKEPGLTTGVVETFETKVARMAADTVRGQNNQIARSIILRGENSGQAILFLTAGGHQVDMAKASALAGEPPGKTDAGLIGAQTGFAIGGVSPVRHLNPVCACLDPHLTEFDIIRATAGTPRHAFPINPQDLNRVTGAQVGDFKT
ncbi:MAG: YbaK/EbsC family protein [Rhodobacteraceae bacterium]|nr:YbaK/EbsC family protein [Paracoccaceae bacterium]